MTGPGRRHPGESRSLAGPRAEKTVSLALQGGGAHGAFTWGVLDALLEDEPPSRRSHRRSERRRHERRRDGAGLARGRDRRGAERARNLLAPGQHRRVAFPHPAPTPQLDARLLEQPGLDQRIAQGFGPYKTNPLNINPLRDAIDALIDFDRVRACTDVEIFISATNVWTGKVAIFKRQELTADHLMASACLPTVFQAVEIDGEPYWDGGYMGNPALFPLFDQTTTADILLVQINPLERRQTPRTAREIHDRLNEITFNGNLLRELRAVAFVKRLIEEGKLSPDEYKNVHLHRIDASSVLDEYEASSKRNAEWDFFVQLRDAGRRTARSWLAEHYGAIGVRGTLDLQSVLP